MGKKGIPGNYDYRGKHRFCKLKGVKTMNKKIEEELEFLRKQIKELNSFNDCLSRAQLTLSRFMMHIDNRIRNIEKKLE
jgi:hypothetical protein